MWALVLLVGCGVVEQAEPLAETVDLIEINHYYNEEAKIVFEQIIFFDWSPFEGRYQVRAWRLLKSEEQLPSRDPVRGGYVAIFHDGDILRRIWSQYRTESWTQYDHELAERDFLAKEKRQELIKRPPKPPPLPPGMTNDRPRSQATEEEVSPCLQWLRPILVPPLLPFLQSHDFPCLPLPG